MKTPTCIGLGLLMLGFGIGACGGAEPLDAWSWCNPLPQGNVLNGVTWAEGQFVAVGRAGAALTSPDGVQWSFRATGVTNDLSKVTPAWGQFWAVGDGGVVLSSPDGIHWNRGPSATTNRLNQVVFGDNRLVAVGEQGTVVYSSEGNIWAKADLGAGNRLRGATWGNGLCVAVGVATNYAGEYGVVFTSTNAANWMARTILSPVSPCPLWTVAFGNSRFIARGKDAALAFSTNGTTWTNLTSSEPLHDNFTTVIFQDPMFIAMGAAGTPVTSTDGRTWIRRIGSAGNVYDLAWGEEVLAAVGGLWSGSIATTTNLFQYPSWTTRDTGFTDSIQCLADAGQFRLGVGSGKAFVSDDGCRWTTSSMGTNAYWDALTIGNGKQVAASRNGCILVSTNGLQWTVAVASATNRFLTAIHAQDRFIVAGDSRTVMISTDGNTWSNLPPANGVADFSELAYSSGLYVAVANVGKIFTSSDLINWSLAYSPTNGYLKHVAFGQGTWVAVGTRGAAAWSTNGLWWTPVDAGTTNELTRVTHSGCFFVALGPNGWFASSSDGRTWTPHQCPTLHNLNGAVCVNGRLLLAGNSGTILRSDPLARLMVRMNAGMELILEGQPGFGFRLECTDDLGGNWQPAAEPPEIPGVWRDPTALSSPQRFYRVTCGP